MHEAEQGAEYLLCCRGELARRSTKHKQVPHFSYIKMIRVLMASVPLPRDGVTWM